MAFFSLFNSRVCRTIWCFSFCSSSRNFSLLWSFACKAASGYSSADPMADLKRPVENSADSIVHQEKILLCVAVWKKIMFHAILKASRLHCQLFVLTFFLVILQRGDSTLGIGQLIPQCHVFHHRTHRLVGGSVTQGATPTTT